jgi:hypothetical protein
MTNSKPDVYIDMMGYHVGEKLNTTEKVLAAVDTALDHDQLICLRLYRDNGYTDVLLLPHKDGSGWSYVNLTKGHICLCVFPTYADAIYDLDNHNIRDFHFIETCDTREV